MNRREPELPETFVLSDLEAAVAAGRESMEDVAYGLFQDQTLPTG